MLSVLTQSALATVPGGVAGEPPAPPPDPPIPPNAGTQEGRRPDWRAPDAAKQPPHPIGSADAGTKTAVVADHDSLSTLLLALSAQLEAARLPPAEIAASSSTSPDATAPIPAASASAHAGPTGNPAPPGPPVTVTTASAGEPLPPLPPVGLMPIGTPSAVPSLPSALNAAQHTDPQAARQTVNTVVPQANASLGATALFFLSALRGGDVRGWLGDRTMRAIEAGGRGDAARLAAEFSATARQVAEIPPTEWRPVGIPLYQDGELGEIRMAMRRQDEDQAGDGGDQEDSGHRFVIDVTMSRLGPIQLDGLIRADDIRLVVRSRRGLTADIRQGIRDVFAGACETIGARPALTFQTGAEGWMTVADRRAAAG